jgi:hypothetical protein
MALARDDTSATIEEIRIIRRDAILTRNPKIAILPADIQPEEKWSKV